MITQSTTRKAPKVNRFYALYATEHLVVDMDNDGLYCEVVSESDEDKTYTVRVDESGVAPIATTCNCKSSKPCKHMSIVSSFYSRIYKSNIQKAEAKKAQQETGEQVEETTVCEDVKQPIRIDRFTSSFDRSPVIAAPMLTTNVGMMGCLNVSQPFSLMR